MTKIRPSVHGRPEPAPMPAADVRDVLDVLDGAVEVGTAPALVSNVVALTGARDMRPVASTDALAAVELQWAMDRLSLEQALIDFEVANARVLDLTARLVEANQRAARAEATDAGRAASLAALDCERADTRAALDVARRDAEAARAGHAAVQADNAAIRASRTFRVATRLARVRRLLRG